MNTVGVCIPARNEGSTIGAICSAISTQLMGQPDSLVSDLMVVDDCSSDDTAVNAQGNGARVVRVKEILADFQPDIGKGNAMWKGIAAMDTDIVVFCDGDLLDFQVSYISRLAETLLADDSLIMVKGYYERGFHDNPEGGGRTTALMARPALSIFFPQLAHIHQPLGGEYAIRRKAAKQIPFTSGWGVEVALLVDVAKQWGSHTIGQVELPRRTHRHRPLDELSIQSSEILRILLLKAGVEWQDGWSSVLKRPGLEDLEIKIPERPPLCSLD